jgi:hypothetical protein
VGIQPPVDRRELRILTIDQSSQHRTASDPPVVKIHSGQVIPEGAGPVNPLVLVVDLSFGVLRRFLGASR